MVTCAECGRVLDTDQVIRIGSDEVCEGCKPILIQKLREGLVKQTSEEIRRSALGHESLIRCFGFICFGWATLHIELVYSALRNQSSVALVATFVITIIAGSEIALGIGLMRLRRWARLPAWFYGVFSWLAIFLELPLVSDLHPGADSTLPGMRILFTGALLWLLATEKCRVAFSYDYIRVIAETPAIGRRFFWVTATVLGFVASLGILLALLF